MIAGKKLAIDLHFSLVSKALPLPVDSIGIAAAGARRKEES